MKLNRETYQILADYERYLEDGIIRTEKSIGKYRKQVENFIAWANSKEYTEIKYIEIMEYIRYCRSQGMSSRNINNYLRSVRHFFDYLNKEKSKYLNPISG